MLRWEKMLAFSNVQVLLAALALFALIHSTKGWANIEDNRADPSLYSIGIGIADSTGPVAGVNLMGYANLAQIGRGIHFRLYSRAFVFDDDIRRFVYVCVDAGMIGQLTKLRVISRLTELYGDIYSFENVMISSTHTHSGPAGFLQHLLFDITSLGFIPETLDAMVDGIVESIVNAHENMTPGYIDYSIGELTTASINRSPTGYLNNPEDERLLYDDNTDNVMTLLKFSDVEGNGLGMLNWFAVHATSMNLTNKLVSGDNKGYASQLFEMQMDPGTLPGQGSFVAAFAQANSGDASPNTRGPRCLDTGLPCDMETSTCGGKANLCAAFGPGEDMVESTKIIGEMQYEKAMELYHSDTLTRLSGPIQYSQQLVDMSQLVVNLPSGEQVQLCKSALGYSFAGGTIDGGGALVFTQGMTESLPFFDIIVDSIRQIEPEQMVCHSPKPILLDTGNFNYPYPWHPHILDTQVGRIGSLFITALPAEITTMAGRRVKNKVVETAIAEGLTDPISVLSGLTNGYSHYVVTNEEYMVQRYEAASTIFGPNTLEGYMQQFTYLVETMANDEQPPVNEQPEDLSDVLLTLLPGVFFDTAEAGYRFGEVIAEPYPLAYNGETVIAKFAAGHPRNDLRRGTTYLQIEKLGNDTEWELIATDSSWETRFEWHSIAILLGTSEATVYWDTSDSTEEGTYRIKHFGASKSVFTGIITPYEGTTQEFRVVRNETDTNLGYENELEQSIDQMQLSWMEMMFGDY